MDRRVNAGIAVAVQTGDHASSGDSKRPVPDGTPLEAATTHCEVDTLAMRRWAANVTVGVNFCWTGSLRLDYVHEFQFPQTHQIALKMAHG